jgi:hypothetical protein
VGGHAPRPLLRQAAVAMLSPVVEDRISHQHQQSG